MKDIFLNEKITEYGVIPFENDLVINRRLLPTFDINSIIVFLVPYKSHLEPKDHYGVSSYARVKDYHGYMKCLFERLTPRLEEKYGLSFCGFSDHSPLNEKLCAAKAGLGVIGKNSLLINKKYGSFVFIGIFVSQLKTDNVAFDIKKCLDCDQCINACPGQAIGDGTILSEKCLSGLSQKKQLTDEEQKTVTDAGLCWGCDVCQDVCPMNKNALFSNLPYFSETFLDNLSPSMIKDMSEDEYNKYAFSWRKKDVLLRNMHFLDKKLNNNL